MKKNLKVKHKFIIHISMSRAGSGFLCSLLDNHPSIFIPHFDNVNENFLKNIINNKKTSFSEKKQLALSHLKAKQGKDKFIYFGMHNPDEKQLKFLNYLGDCKIIISTRDTVSSFCNRLEKERDYYKGFIPASYFHSLSINTIAFSNFNYSSYNIFEILLPELHLYPKETLEKLCNFLKIKFNTNLLVGTEEGNPWEPKVSKYEIQDSKFNYDRYLNRNKSYLYSKDTRNFIQTISKGYERNFSNLNKYIKSSNSLEKQSKFSIFISLFKFNNFDKEIYSRIPKKFFILNLISYVSLRYYLFLSFFKIKKTFIFNLSPYVMIYIILSKFGFDNNKGF